MVCETLVSRSTLANQVRKHAALSRIWNCSAIQWRSINIREFLRMVRSARLTSMQLDEVFYTPRLLATVLFSFHRILLATTAGNSRTLAIYLLALAYPHVPAAHLSVDQIKLVAILIQSSACLFLYFLRRTCFVTNGIFALFKIGSIWGLSIAGLKMGPGHYAGQADFSTKMPGYNAIGALSGMTHIIYTYQGFENVNCVGRSLLYVQLLGLISLGCGRI